MKTDYQFDGPPASNGSGEDAVDRVKRNRQNQAIRTLESRESEFATRLGARQKSADELRGRGLAQIDAHEKEYQAERTQTKSKLDQADVHQDAAHRSAGEHCAQIGVHYVPRQTTDEDVLRVPLLEDAEAARRLNLPFGVGFSDTLVKVLKPILTLLCWLMSSMSLGLTFRLLDARNIFANPLMVALSLVMGGVVAVGLLVALTPGWKALGTKMGTGRPKDEVTKMFIPVALITAALFVGLAFMDARAIILLNAARAALNPAYAIPMSVALLIGLLLSGVYSLGLAGTAFASGYNAAARQNIDAFIKLDEDMKREAAKKRVPIIKALEALAEVKVVGEIIQNLDSRFKRLDQEFKRERAEMITALPERPTTLESDERQELIDLRDHVRSVDAIYSAHTMSRSGTAASNGYSNNNDN